MVLVHARGCATTWSSRGSAPWRDSVLHAMTIMTVLRVRHLPVILRGSVVGLISVDDTVKARLAEKTVENRVLQNIAR
jgi:signal-transduction protein with cAMP-binding, CBS, and nucleotidyltransferase domain